MSHHLLVTWDTTAPVVTLTAPAATASEKPLLRLSCNPRRNTDRLQA